MSRDRLINFISIATGVFLLFFASFVGGQILDPTRDVVTDQMDDPDKYGGKSMMNSTYAVVTRWAPLLGGGGLIILGFWREFQRQRVAGERPPRGF